MKRAFTLIVGMVVVAGTLIAANKDTVLPAKMSKADIAGAIFDRPDMIEKKRDE